MPSLRGSSPGCSSKINGAGIIITLTPDSQAIIAWRTVQALLIYDGIAPTAATWDVPQNSSRVPFVSVTDSFFNDETTWFDHLAFLKGQEQSALGSVLLFLDPWKRKSNKGGTCRFLSTFPDISFSTWATNCQANINHDEPSLNYARATAYNLIVTFHHELHTNDEHWKHWVRLMWNAAWCCNSNAHSFCALVNRSRYLTVDTLLITPVASGHVKWSHSGFKG